MAFYKSDAGADAFEHVDGVGDYATFDYRKDTITNAEKTRFLSANATTLHGTPSPARHSSFPCTRTIYPSCGHPFGHPGVKVYWTVNTRSGTSTDWFTIDSTSATTATLAMLRTRTPPGRRYRLRINGTGTQSSTFTIWSIWKKKNDKQTHRAYSRGGATSPAVFRKTMACYDNIIGLARKTVLAIEAAPPTGYSTSQSGLYICRPSAVQRNGGYNECGQGSVWDVLDRARTQTVTIYSRHERCTAFCIHATARTVQRDKSGKHTDGKHSPPPTPTQASALPAILCWGGTMKITGIGTLFNASGTLTLKLYNSLNVKIGDDITVNVSNGFTLNTLTTAIELPMYVNFDDKHEYFFGIHLQPVQCGADKHRGIMLRVCATVRHGNPMWGAGHSGNRAWANWIMVGGWTGNTLTEFDQCSQTSTTRMNGLALQVELGCDVGLVLCNEALDFTRDTLALSMAHAILWKSGEIAASLLLGSTRFTRTATANREFLKEQRAMFAKNTRTTSTMLPRTRR